MICAHCAAGADLTTEPSALPKATRKLALAEHDRCPGGTWCDCKHKVASVEVITARRAAMGRGGLARVVSTLAELSASSGRPALAAPRPAGAEA